MKKKFNAYCLAMLIALAAVLVLPSLVTFSSGFMDGWSSEDKQPGYHPVHNSTSMVQMMPRKAMFPDSIHNMTSGEYEDMMVMNAVVRSKTEPSMSDPLFTVGSPVIGAVTVMLGIFLVVMLVKIVISINRNQLFDKKMQTRLAQGGWALIAMYTLNWMVVFINYRHNCALYNFDDYVCTIINFPPATLLISGIAMLLVGQVFAIAQRMKEEQELTI